MRHYSLALLCLFLLFSCKEDNGDDPGPQPPDGETEAEIQLGLLTDQTWVPGTITKDGTDLTEKYPYFADFTLSFSGNINSDGSNVTNGTYDTNDEGSVLPDGSWEFGTNAETTLILTDNFNGQTEVTYNVKQSSLRLQFTRDDSNGRTEAVSGQYVFDLVPQTP